MSRSREQLEKELSSTSEELKEIRHNYLELKLEVARRTREEEVSLILKYFNFETFLLDFSSL